MALFQKSVLNKYLDGLDQTKVDAAYQKFSAHFHNPAIQLNIRKSKEEQYQGEFLIDLFVKVLGYTKNPQPNFNLTTEYKNVKDSKKADGAILQKGKAIAVIELKGMNTPNLDKIEVQAFGYKNNQPEAIYIITSNFEKLRFYIDNAVDFIEWNLFNLTREQFNEVWLCLAQESILSGLPKQIKEDSIIEEKTITERLYKDYSTFRGELYNSMSKHNPDIDPLLLFKKTQKLLDRFLFIFFAEDRLLVPPNSITRIIDRWRQLAELDHRKPLYEIFQQYFGYFNSGRKGKKPVDDIFAYNGGLFKPDATLDSLKVDDFVLLKHTSKLTKYDFVSEVDVNILGHIFEHSLNDIEEIAAQLEGETLDKSVSKRKKDGVFYTPKYITKYIVENTVGKLCEEKKTELGIDNIDFSKTYLTKNKRTTKDGKKTFLSAEGEKILNGLTEYREYLLGLTICDPACGSGAFLNQAFNYLIDEHENIDQYNASLRGDMLTLTDVSKDILEKNLFGVDINNEAVEIAKLSLWLRTAQKGRKLNNLNENIKCGNSLIDDPEVAGEKAFSWETEFPEVFKNGGFDVVIGNPPYVNLEKVQETSIGIKKQGYKTYNKRGDLYCIFVEKGFSILKSDGVYSYIMPNKWLQAGYGKELRLFFLTKKLIELIDFGDIQIFDGATTYPCIFIAQNSKPQTEFKVSVLQSANSSDFQANVLNTSESFLTSEFSGDTWVISSKKEKTLLTKLKSKFKSLTEFVEGNANYGIKFGLTEAFLINEEKKNSLISKDENSKKLIGSILRGRNLTRYGTPNKSSLDSIILASFGSYKYIENDYPAIYEHLLPFEEKLKKRGQCNGSKETTEKPFKGQHHWLELDNNPTHEYLELYSKPKIMYQKFQVKPCFIFDNQQLYCNDSMWIIPTDNKGLLGILNSKMGWWLITKYCTQIQNGCQLIWKYFGQIPISNINSELPILVNSVLVNNQKLDKAKQQFIRLFQRKFKLEKLSRNLQNWHILTFSDFVKELKKKKIKLGLAEEMEWEGVFEAEKVKALEIKAVIDKTDREIDQMVYGLYGLTEEEIQIVEKS